MSPALVASWTRAFLRLEPLFEPPAPLPEGGATPVTLPPGGGATAQPTVVGGATAQPQALCLPGAARRRSPPFPSAASRGGLSP